MNSRLHRFLPHHPASDPGDGWESATRHLHALFSTLRSYAPREVVWAELAQAAPPPTYERLDASLLFADVSGFTALSERLATLGREGAEQVTDAINAYFTAIVEILNEYGGSILKFGGDALVVGFYQPEHPLAAASAALLLQQRMGQWHAQSSLGAVPLRLSIGLGSGELLMLRLGHTERREIILLGPAASEIALAEGRASAGEIVAGPGMWARLPARWLARQEATLAWLANEVEVPPPTLDQRPPLPPPAAEQDKLAQQLETLAAYLPEGLLERLALDPIGRVEGEHRVVTVLFSNVINLPSYPRSEAGRAAIAAILQEHFVTMQGAIARFGGAVNKIDVAGEGYKLMALFGAPITHEDDPVRAVHAALAMQQALPTLNAQASERLGQPVTLSQRIGLNTGVVFAGNVGSQTRQEYSVMGDPVNLAARIMGQATAGTILVSQSTREFLPPATELRALPPVQVKGKRDPISIFQVEGWSSSNRFAVRQQSPLVGRTLEMNELRYALEQARLGHGQARYLYGEAGIGKSRLALELLEEAQEFLLLDGRSLSYGGSIPYHAWRPVLQQLLELDPTSPPDSYREILPQRLARWLPEHVALYPLLGLILGIEIEPTPTTAPLTPELRQQRLQSLISELLLARAQEQPLLLLMDDVQWIDAVSASLLAFVTRQIGEAPLLFLLLGRRPPESQLAEYGSDLPTLSFFKALPVEELEQEAGLRLAHHLLDMRGLSAQEQRLILDRAGGNPLYIEELADALASEGEVPDTLQGLIMSRLDRLPESSRRVLQVASVVGQRFDEELLEGIYPYQDQQLVTLPNRLGQLSEQGVLLHEQRERALLYTFRHILTHNVVYDSLLFTRRRTLHRDVGRHLKQHPHEWLGDQVSLLSYHYYQAQEWQEALKHTIHAADRAKESYANEAAIDLYQRALDITQHLPATPTDTLVHLWQALGDVYSLIGRYDEALAMYEQAESDVQSIKQRVEVLERQAKVLERQGELTKATAVTKLAKELLEQGNYNPILLARLEQRLGWIYSLIGNHELALTTVNDALSLLNLLDASQRDVAEVLALTLRSIGAIHTSMSDLAKALNYHQQALKLYAELQHPSGIAYCYDYIAEVYYLQGNFDQSMEALGKSLNVQREVGDAYGLVAGLNNQGILYLHAGNLDKAESSYLESLQFARQIGSLQAIGRIYNNLAELAIKRKHFDVAEKMLIEAEVALTKVGDQEELAKLEVYRQAILSHRA